MNDTSRAGCEGILAASPIKVLKTGVGHLRNIPMTKTQGSSDDLGERLRLQDLLLEWRFRRD